MKSKLTAMLGIYIIPIVLLVASPFLGATSINEVELSSISSALAWFVTGMMLEGLILIVSMTLFIIFKKE